jgi:hypothetical protein
MPNQLFKMPRAESTVAGNAMARSRPTMQWEDAEEIAARALAFLASEPAQLSRFLALTGLEPADVRGRTGQPELLTAVLDHLAHDEPLLLVFAASVQLSPEDVGRALSVLQGAGPGPREA